MAKVTTLKPFRDFHARVDRNPGDVFHATEARARQIDALLPGYVTIEAEPTTVAEVAPQEQAPKPDLSAMTNKELAALCKERGIETPKRPTKAQLLKLLGE